MKAVVIFMSLVALTLTGCYTSRRETVVEKPVPQETVVVPAQPRSCTYAGTTYSHGTLSCQGGYQFSCNNGTWTGMNTTCY